MSYSDIMNALIQNGYINYVIILDPNGTVYWTNNPNWAVNGTDVMRQWMTRAPSMMIGGTKFSSFKNDPGETFVGKNLGGGGTVIIQKAPNGYFFLTWSTAECPHQPINIHAEVYRMAAGFA